MIRDRLEQRDLELAKHDQRNVQFRRMRREQDSGPGRVPRRSILFKQFEKRFFKRVRVDNSLDRKSVV